MVGIKNVTFNNFVRMHFYNNMNNMASMKRDTMDARLFYEQTQLKLADPAILLSGPAKMLTNTNEHFNVADNTTINNNNIHPVDPAILLSGPSTMIPNNQSIRYTRGTLMSLRTAPSSRKRPLSFENSEPKIYWTRNSGSIQRHNKNNNSNDGNNGNTDGSNNSRKSITAGGKKSMTSTIFTDFSQPYNRMTRDRGDASRYPGSGRISIQNDQWGNKYHRSNYNFKSNEMIEDKRNCTDTDNNGAEGVPSNVANKQSDEKKFHFDYEQEKTAAAASSSLAHRYACNQEPEWFNEPSSQKDIIELRGFNDSEIDNDLPPDEINDKPITSSLSNKESGDDCNVTATTSSTNQNSSPPAKSTPTKLDDARAKENLKVDQKQTKNLKIVDECATPTEDFNFEDFFKVDSISDLLPKSSGPSDIIIDDGGVSGGGGGGSAVGAMTPNTQSRFSRWFNRSTAAATNDNKSSDNFIEKTYKDWSSMINKQKNSFDFDGDSLKPTVTETELNRTFLDFLHGGKYSAPNANQSAKQFGNNNNNAAAAKSCNVAETLRQLHNNHKYTGPNNNNSMPNVGELESFMRNIPQTSNKSNAFNNFIAQMNNQQTMMKQQQDQQQTIGLIQMLNQNYAQQQQQQQQQQRYYQQQKQQHEQRQLALQQHFRQQRLHEILNQPEAKMLIQGINTGNITKNMLLQYLNNFKISDRQREIIIVILSYLDGNMAAAQQLRGGISPNSTFGANSPNADFLRIGMASGSGTPPSASANQNRPNFSPFHKGGMPQSIPSPQELKCHTNSIMQNAFMRRKMEEQQETMRKRQEFQQRISSLAKPTCNANGRSTVRNNVPKTTEPKMQPKSETKKQPTELPMEQRKPSSSKSSATVNAETEHKKRSSNEQPTGSAMEKLQLNSRVVNESTTTTTTTTTTSTQSLNNNQLTNWFSAELLAQASAGQLPSIAGLFRAPSLEDLERDIQTLNDKTSK